MSKNDTVYALYKGDEFIDLGTSASLAKKHNVLPGTIRKYATKRWAKRGDDKYIAVKIGKLNDDLEAEDE